MLATGDNYIPVNMDRSCRAGQPMSFLKYLPFALLNPCQQHHWQMREKELSFSLSPVFLPLPRYIPTNEPSPALGTCTRNQPYAWGPACPLSPRGKAAILKGPMPSLLEETGERALDCATEITAVPRMPASFINFIAEKPIWLPCSVAR